MIGARLAAGIAFAALVALAARRAGALSASGAAAAIVVGAAATAAGWSWALLLVVYFTTSVALTRFHAATKATRTGALVAKGGSRDAVQVLANGGVFALAAVLSVLSGWQGWRAIGAGAVAAAASDTWATEVGMLASVAPRAILTGRRVPAGTSGGVSAQGLAAAFAGAAFVAVVARLLGWPPRVAIAALGGGVAGSTIDSLLGATVQVRRWCDRCDAPTEREIHGCGTRTRVVGGVAWVNNDVVNAAATVAGGLLALLLAR